MSTIKQTHELKALRTRLETAKAELEVATDAKKAAQSAEDRARSKIKTLQEQIADIEANSKDPIVTEHALLRYIERVYGIDLDELRGKILNPKTKQWIEQFGSGKIPSDGCRLIVKNRVVVTVEPQ